MGLSLLLLALVLFGASQGALKISFDALFDEEYRDIWLNIRLPRVLLAVLVGAALAAAGVIMQGLFATQWLTLDYSASVAVLH